MSKHRRLIPSPSGFADYMYCGHKWLLKKTRPVKSNHLTQESIDLKIGQENEDLCVDWVLDKINVTENHIIYKGTNRSNRRELKIMSNDLKMSLLGKPDLVIEKEGRVLLFEFKALKREHYLITPEFKALHAQLWCYKNIEDFLIDDFYLLRYFRSPYNNKELDNYKLKKLSKCELSNSNYSYYYEKYLNAIESFNDGSKDIINYLDYPKNTNGIVHKKCKNCFYGKKEFCGYNIK